MTGRHFMTPEPLSAEQERQREIELSVMLAGGSYEMAARIRRLPLFKVATDGRLAFPDYTENRGFHINSHKKA